MTGPLVQGTVVAFDEHRGLGTVRADDGTELSFHCTQIADGSRTIAVDQRVTFELRPGHLGRWEAGVLAPLGSAGSRG